MRFSAAGLAAHLGGELVGPDVSIDGASIDSRTILRERQERHRRGRAVDA